MAIAHDASTRFPVTEGTSDVTSGNRTFTHTPSGTPKGVVVALCCSGLSTVVSGVLYGGLSMTLTTSATDTSEAGRVELWTLTNVTIPTGPQTVTLQGAGVTPKFCTCSTVTAATAVTNVNTSSGINTTTAADPAVTLTTTASTQIYGALHTGNASPAVTPAAGCTLQNNLDYGQLASNTLRRTSADAAGSPVLGVTLISDDYCIAAVALEEFGAAAALPPPLVMARHL